MDGKLYSWGDNYHGQCGVGEEGTEKHYPVPVKGLEGKHIVQVACGRDHTLALEYDHGHVYSWGRGSYGVLGLGNDGDWNEPNPKQLVHLDSAILSSDYNGDYVVYIAAGSTHNAVCTVQGQVYLWGRCDEGALGMGEMRPRVSIRKPLRLDLGKSVVTHVACGKNHTVFVTGNAKEVCSDSPRQRSCLQHG